MANAAEKRENIKMGDHKCMQPPPVSGGCLDDSCDNLTAAVRTGFLCGVVLTSLPVNQMPAERLQSCSPYYRGM